MSLKEYQRKRNFRQTPEPQGDGAATPGNLFVVQKHAARRLHYDFRLELEGTLKSWAVPKGPNLNPSVKALAVHVEDHPLDYASFEGVIPAGQYGGGTVMVWDQGTWEPEGDPLRQYRQGKLTFQLHGQKLKGAWTLVRMSGRAGEDGKNWLLIKKQDPAARKTVDITQKEPRSVLSDREMQAIADDADRVWTSHKSDNKRQAKAKPTAKRAKSSKRTRTNGSLPSWNKRLPRLPGARAAPMPDTLAPQLATLASGVPEGDDWLHELKFDGYRMLAFVEADSVRLVTRKGNDWTHRFALAEAVQRLPLTRAILDGEIVALDDDGRSNFQELQNLMKRGNGRRLVYYVFDTPYLEGYDLTDVPLIERKKLLAGLLQAEGSENYGQIRYSDHVLGQGQEVLSHACRFAMEGVVSKRVDSRYQSTRTASWLKSKCLSRQEFVIGGYTRPKGSRIGFGALLLGYYDQGELIYAGSVGTGFTRETLRRMRTELTGRRTDEPPFAQPPRDQRARGVTWVRPELVAEIEFTEWTEDGMLRHPSFQGLRSDKPPEEIVRETPRSLSALKESAMLKQSVASVSKSKQRSAPSRKKSSSESAEDTVAQVRITNPDRVLYPEQGLTKRELAEFYASIADWILPHVTNRPLTLVRCPRGRSGQCFYQKHLSEQQLVEHLRTVAIQEKEQEAQYVVVDDIAGLVALVQLGVLEFHVWPVLADQLEQPDQLVIDLDPGPNVTWEQVVAAARDVRDRIAEQGLQSFVRTSGGKGLHVVAPLRPGPTWDDLKSFAKSIATELAEEQPKKYVATSSKAKRGGKVFVDYLRNSRGATAVASYSTRARAGAPLAVPLRWEELGSVESAAHYTVANIKRRLSALRSDPWRGFFKLRQSLP